MDNSKATPHFFGTERVELIIARLAPPIMFAQLIHGLYNVVDSYFVGQYSSDGLTALSLIFPIQLLISALSQGTGIGINTLVSKFNGAGDEKRASQIARVGTLLAILNWAVFALLAFLFLEKYLAISTPSLNVRKEALTYGMIVCLGSLGLFLDVIWTKIHQADGNMKRPMVAQIVGTIVNIVFDWILIYGKFGVPAMGIAGAAIATVIGQCAAALITFSGGFRGFPSLGQVKKNTALIYRTGFPSFVMQSLYTVYIFGLNQILVQFSDAAVTALGLYYKLQSFFFIPMFGLQGCVLPVLSYNFAAKYWARCRRIIKVSLLAVTVFMGLGMVLFMLIPGPLISMFGANEAVLAVGIPAFRIIALGFIPASIAMLMPIVFQGLGRGRTSLMLTLLRQIVLLVPIAWILSHFGLIYTWLTFPISETITVVAAFIFFRNTLPKADVDSNLEGIEKLEKDGNDLATKICGQPSKS